MPWFDLLVLALLLASVGFGLVRGATRELVSVGSLVAALAAAIYGLRFTGALGRSLVHPDWAGTLAAVVVTFAGVYLALRLAGAALAGAVQATPGLGLLDRSVGAGFGLIRALVVLGLINIAFTALTPPSLIPQWLTTSTFYPLTSASAAVIRSLAPRGRALAQEVAPRLESALRDGRATARRDLSDSRGYDARERNRVDDLVEQSR